MHFLPECYRQALADAGLATVDGGIPVPSWSEDAALAALDRLGVATAMLSVTSPSVRFVEDEAERTLCRQVNLAGIDLVRRHPDRFGLFATLPMSSIDDALAELAFAFDELSADGIVLETNIRGAYLGNPKFTPLFDELDRRGAVVFLHPTSPACFEAMALGRPAPMIAFPMDTARTVVDLLYNGVLQRCRNLKMILPHGGGALPALTPRIANFAGSAFVSPRPKDAAEVYSVLKDLYYDVVSAAHPAPFSALRAIAPIEQLLFGTDWPFSGPERVEINQGFLEGSGLTPTELDMVARKNAERLFPRLVCTCADHATATDASLA
jgi:predicted TIM-barrel fold metal-dependent hydrolase